MPNDSTAVRNTESGTVLSEELSKVLPLSHCLNQDSQDLGIFKMEIPNPANPFILIILIQTLLRNRAVILH